MIISKSQIQNILKAYGSQTSNKLNKKEEVRGALRQDNISISEESRLKQQALKAVKQAADMRTDKVEEIKERISAGTYTLEAGEVAEKMIERALVDRLV